MKMKTLSRPDLSDIKQGDWVDRRLPLVWRPYTRLARLDRPVGIWLTLFRAGRCLSKHPTACLSFATWSSSRSAPCLREVPVPPSTTSRIESSTATWNGPDFGPYQADKSMSHKPPCSLRRNLRYRITAGLPDALYPFGRDKLMRQRQSAWPLYREPSTARYKVGDHKGNHPPSPARHEADFRTI